MSTTRILSVALVTALTIGAAQPGAQAVSEDGLLRSWLSAVVQHRPEQADAAASLVANWSAAEVELLLPGLFIYLDQARQTEFKNRDVPKCSTCAVSRDERERLLRVTRPRVSRTYQALVSNLPKPDRLNDLLLRAVTLHSDATMFPKNAGRQLTGAPTPSTNVLGAHRSEVQTLDGQYFGSTPVAPHWYLARALLNFTLPEPALDGRARRWYLAASTYFAATSDAAHIAAHFAAMGTLFPDDAMVMFDLGWLAEAHSTARMQTHRRALVDAASRRFGGRQGAALCSFIPCDGHRNPYGIKNERESLLDAERYFARAVALDPIYAALTLVGDKPGRSLVLVFSDGIDTASWLPAARLLETVKASPAVVYAASVGDDATEMLREVTDASGGRHVAVESTRNLEATFSEFLGEFRKRYVLGYEPKNTTPGWHRLEIKVRRSGVDVRARPGYTAPRNP